MKKAIILFVSGLSLTAVAQETRKVAILETVDKLYITPYYLLQNIEGNKALAERADTSPGGAKNRMSFGKINIECWGVCQNCLAHSLSVFS